MDVIEGDHDVLGYQPRSLESYPSGISAKLRGGLSREVTVGIESLWSDRTLHA